jgi:2-methylcitrate dehydratase PrpD
MSAVSIMEPMIAIATIDARHIPDSARRIATFSLFDWMVVTRAGRNEPVSRIVLSFVAEEGGKAVASVVGSSVLLPARAAALANGSISHALDYDDTHFAFIGHPSVAVAPAALAAAEQVNASAAALRDAYLLGAEASCRIGMVLGRAHYQRGFHQTIDLGGVRRHDRGGSPSGFDANGDAPRFEPRQHAGLGPQIAVRNNGKAFQCRDRRRQWHRGGKSCKARICLL